MAIIPELEAISKPPYIMKKWDPDEIDTLERYFNRVPIETLMKYLPNRTEGAIRVRVSMLKNKKLPGVTEE
jgi:hypothetical protein